MRHLTLSRKMITVITAYLLVTTQLFGSVPNQSRLATSIAQMFSDYFYDPDLLQSEPFKNAFERQQQLLNGTADTEAFIVELNNLWSDVNVSHIQFTVTGRSAEEIYHTVDSMNTGPKASSLNIQNDIAILKINTMMGRDNEQAIAGYMRQIIDEQKRYLIIDLRGNKGGAFVIRSLLSYFVPQPVTIGAFVSTKWYQTQHRLPENDEIHHATPYHGDSLIEFWKIVQANALTRVEIQPAPDRYHGKVYVLVDHNTESAAEMATAALKQMTNATIIGEKTAGKMLSQQMFDIAEGVQIAIPVANYVSVTMGQIESNGITPDIILPPQDALIHIMDKLQK